MNIRAIGPKLAVATLRHIIEHTPQMSVILWGRPGVGKTEMVFDLGRKVYDVRLSHILPTDLFGLPAVSGNRTRFFPPSFLPDSDSEEPMVLFLDELAAADEQTRIAAYGLILERRIGDYTLPKNCAVIAASNRLEDGAASADLGTALNDRLIHLNVEPNHKDWLAWASTHDIHAHVMAFIAARPNHLNRPAGLDSVEFPIAPSPRSWARVSALMQSNPSLNVLNIGIEGILGEAVATEFIGLRDVYAALRPIKEYIDARHNAEALQAMFPTDIDAAFAVVCGALTATSGSAKSLVTGLELASAIDALSSELPIRELAKLLGSNLVDLAIERRYLSVGEHPSWHAFCAAMI